MIKERLQHKKAKADLEKTKIELITQFKTLLEHILNSIYTATYKIENIQDLTNFFKKNSVILKEHDEISILILEEYTKFSSTLMLFIEHQYAANRTNHYINDDVKIFLHLIFISINNNIIKSIIDYGINLSNNLIRNSCCTILADQNQIYNFLGWFYYSFLASYNWNFFIPGMISKFYHHLMHTKQKIIVKDELIFLERDEDNKHFLSLELGKDLLYYRNLELYAAATFPAYAEAFNHLSLDNMEQLNYICKITETILFGGKTGEKITKLDLSKRYHSKIHYFVKILKQDLSSFLGDLGKAETETYTDPIIDQSIISQKNKILAISSETQTLLAAKELSIVELNKISKECLLILKDPATNKHRQFFNEALQQLEEVSATISKIIEQNSLAEHYTRLLKKEINTTLITPKTKTRNTRISKKENLEPRSDSDTDTDSDTDAEPEPPTPILFSIKSVALETKKSAQNFYLEAAHCLIATTNIKEAVYLAEQAIALSENVSMRAISFFLLSDLYFSSYDNKNKNSEQLNLLEKSLEYCQTAIKNYEILDSHIPGIPDFSPDALLTWAQIRKEELLNSIDLIERFIKRKEMDREAIIEQLGERWKKGSAQKPSEKTLAYRAIIALKPQLKRLGENHLALEERLCTIKSKQKGPKQSMAHIKI